MEITQAILLACQGQQAGFTYLMDRYWGEVFGFLIKRTDNEADAEDITMETFAKAFDKIRTYKSEFQFNTWLLTIARNAHIDHIRREKHHFTLEHDPDSELQALFIADETPSAEDQLIRDQQLSALLDCIKQLKPHYQEVIQLRYFQELSYLEMAEVLHEPLSNVKIKLLRAKKLLADLIQQRQSSEN